MSGKRISSDERLQIALELVIDNVGTRPYRLVRLFMQKTGLGRATSEKYVARARRTLADERSERLADLAATLPARYGDALARAKAAEDLKSESRLLRGIGDLVKNQPADEPAGEFSGVVFFATDDPAAEPEKWEQPTARPDE